MNLEEPLVVTVHYDEDLSNKLERLRALGNIEFQGCLPYICTKIIPVPKGQGGTMQMRILVAEKGLDVVNDMPGDISTMYSLDGDAYQFLDLIEQYWNRLLEMSSHGLRLHVRLVDHARGGNGRCYLYIDFNRCNWSRIQLGFAWPDTIPSY
jgi:hypothetical protein